MKKALLFWLALCLTFFPFLPAYAQGDSEDSENCSTIERPSPPAGAMVADGLVVRPMGVIFLAVGIVATAVTLPFSLPSGSVGEMSEKLIAKPFAFTFSRPIGVLPEDSVPWY